MKNDTRRCFYVGGGIQQSLPGWQNGDIDMKKKQNGKRVDKGISLLLSIVLVFGILGVVVFSVAHKISEEMSASAIQNLSESLDLIKCTIESMLDKDVEFQKLMAKEIAMSEDPEAYIRTWQENQTIVKISFVRSGERMGVTSTGERFDVEELDRKSVV